MDWPYFRVTSNFLDSVLGLHISIAQQHHDHSWPFNHHHSPCTLSPVHIKHHYPHIILSVTWIPRLNSATYFVSVYVRFARHVSVTSCTSLVTYLPLSLLMLHELHACPLACQLSSKEQCMGDCPSTEPARCSVWAFAPKPASHWSLMLNSNSFITLA